MARRATPDDPPPAGAPALDDLLVFSAVAECGGFTAAADRLGRPKGRVSTVVQRLERALGAPLFTRTTRRVALTAAGRQLHEQTRPLLQGLADALAGAGREDAALSGPIRVATSVDHATQFLGPVLARFAARHPGLQVELRASDRVVDLVAEGIDVAFRMGWLRDSSLRATKLGEFEQWVVAAPAYLSRARPARASRAARAAPYTLPRHPAELASMEWIALTLLPTPLTWRFTDAHGQVETVRMTARVRTDSAAALRALVLGGAGVTAMTRLSVEEDVRAGRLLRLLPAWSLPTGGIHAVFPPGGQVPARVRALLECYREALAEAARAGGRTARLAPTPRAPAV